MHRAIAAHSGAARSVSLPETLRAAVEQAIGGRIAEVQNVGGGSISNTARVEFVTHEHALLKWVTGSRAAAMLREEARSLKSLSATRTVRVPEVFFLHHDFLLLEWLEPGRRTAQNQRLLGEQLAELHGHTYAQYGWTADNFIGSLPQSNHQHDSWAAFYRAERLEPQIRMAASQLGAEGCKRFDRLLDELPQLLGVVEHEGPSLLHGDLWSGNMHPLADGGVALIDPSTYYGHREVDIAMSKLFGGFGSEFYEAYASAWPHEVGFEQRIALYQLYYLLVHVNIFGGSYVAQTMGLVRGMGF
jgi:protein-ribulosamine 3-kinase